DLSSIRLFCSGADAMPPGLVDRFRKLGCAATFPSGAPLLSAAFAEVYGMVELSGPAIVKLTPATPVEGTHSQRAGTRVRAALRLQHPLLAEAVVFGAPHPTKGATPAAAVVLKPGAQVTPAELLAWCRENIAPYKSPRSVAIARSSDFPRNANGKIVKDALR